MRKELKNDLLKSIVFIGILVLLIVIIGGYLGTAGRGFEDADFLKRYSVYFYFLIGGAIIVLASQSYNYIKGKLVFYYPISEPEDSLTGKNIIFNHPILLTLIALCFGFGFAFYFAFFQNIFFSAIPQSVAGLTSIWSQSLLPLAENLFFFALLPFILLNINRKLFGKSKFTYWFGNLIIIPLISAFGWLGFHNLVYAGQEVAQLQTFIFGFVWVFITLLTMSQIPALILHFFVNFASATRGKGYFGSDLFIFILILSYIGLLITTYYVFRYYQKKKNAN